MNLEERVRILEKQKIKVLYWVTDRAIIYSKGSTNKLFYGEILYFSRNRANLHEIAFLDIFSNKEQVQYQDEYPDNVRHLHHALRQDIVNKYTVLVKQRITDSRCLAYKFSTPTKIEFILGFKNVEGVDKVIYDYCTLDFAGDWVLSPLLLEDFRKRLKKDKEVGVYTLEYGSFKVTATKVAGVKHLTDFIQAG